MTITALPTPPSRSDPTNFAARGDAFLGALPTFVTEANSTAAAVNADKVTSGEKADIATAKAVIATDQAAISTAQAVISTAKAVIATDQATSASASASAAVATLAQTQYARDQALSGLGAADNSQLLSVLMGTVMQAIDLAALAARQSVDLALETSITQIIRELSHLHDMAGNAAIAASSAARLVAAPASASAAGRQGDIAYDTGFIYVCTALNTWKRVAIATW